MKNQILKVVTILFVGLVMVACKDAKNKTEATVAEEVKKATNEAVKYTANADNSTLAWKGSKIAGSHNGTIKISEGYFSFEGDKLAGGNFVIDMNTITVLDLEDAEKNGNLTGHLKSGDFFDVEKFSSSAFAITGIEDKGDHVMVSGNLTVKGIRKNIEFPAKVSVNGDEFTFKSEPFTIDRTEWGIEYKSGKFTDLAKIN